MNNSKWQTLLHDYIDGKLSPADAELLEAELRVNPELQAEERGLRALQQAVAQLPREIEPPAELWANIESRMKNSAANEYPRDDGHTWGDSIWFRLSAIAVAAGITLGGLHLFLNPTTSGIIDSVIPPTPAMAEVLKREVAGTEREYNQSKALLMSALEENRERMNPATLTLVEENLQIIEEAVDEIRAAMADDPENPQLVKMLVATRQKELDFLEEIIRVP